MQSENSQEATLPFLFGVIWKHKWLVAAFITLVMIATVIFTKRQTRLYEAKTQLVIELNAPQYLSNRGREVVSLGTGYSWNTREFFETQYRIIRSRMVAKIVVERLGLERDLDFLGVNQLEDEAARARRLETVDPVAIVVRSISVEPVADSRVVLIKVKDRDPARAARIADTVAAAYADQNVGRKVSAAGDAVTWLKQQADQLKSELDAADNGLLEYKRSKGILGASLADKQQLVGMDLQDARRQLREAKRETIHLRTELDQLKSLSIDEVQTSVKEVLTNGLIQRLKEQLVNLRNERAELHNKLDKHPDVQVLDKKIARVKKSLGEEVAGIRGSLKRAWKSAQESERELVAEVEGLEAQARQLQAMELEYKRHADQVDSRKTLHAQMLGRLKEAELQAQSRANNVRVLDAALVPSSPKSPRLLLNLIVAALLSLIGGLGLALLVERLDNSVKTQEQLEAYGLTFLGIIPSFKALRGRGGLPKGGGNPDRCVIDHPNSTAAECVRTIRTNLLFMAPERELRSMMITSAGPREGKTCTCVNIGATMAMSGSRTLLIDSDLRRPRLHKIFGMSNASGLTNLIMDPSVGVEEVAQPTEVPGLDIIGSGPLPPNPSELLHTTGLRRTLDRALEAYDRVIFDSPPVGAVTDAQILGQQVDGAVLVVRAGETNREMLAKSKRLLSNVNVRLLGALLNNLDVSSRGYGQYYYQYYRQQGPYAADDVATEQS